jgi:regulator of protease activity HflC (stomatin/prohibitin superfamily)
VLRAEGAKQAAILEAEGRREAAFRDAEAREREAEAEAKATDMVSAAISKGDINAVRYFLGLKYVEAFGQLATSNQQRTVIVPADLSGLAGLVEGLRSLNAQAEGGPWAPPRTPTPAPSRD